jgi:hypothetical protein
MNDRTLERFGAASGIIAALLFGVAFVIYLANDPSKVPDIAHANDATQFISNHRDAIRAELLLNSIAITVFIWFLGNLWSRYRTAEGGPARVSAIASAGGIVGASMVLAAFVVEATTTLKPGVENVPEFYVLSTLLIGLGGAAFTVFFLASASVILRHGALSTALGLLAVVAGIASALGFVTIFATHGVFNAANGAFGFWVRYAAFVVWVLIASIALTGSVGSGPARRSTGRSTARRRR